MEALNLALKLVILRQSVSCGFLELSILLNQDLFIFVDLLDLRSVILAHLSNLLLKKSDLIRIMVDLAFLLISIMLKDDLLALEL
jgi:hypothetical protein